VTDDSQFSNDFFVAPGERDPLRAARESGRPPLPKRFYEVAAAVAAGDGFGVALDRRSVKTPAKHLLAVPSRALAEALAAEWARQGAQIDPADMPLTRLVNSALDGVALRSAEVEADVVKFAASDLVCYRAGEPASLVAAQTLAWDPLLRFVKDRLGARFTLAEGVMFTAQPDSAIAAIAAAVRAQVGAGPAAPLRLAGLHAMTALTGSVVIALAVASREIDAAAGWAAAHVDEDYQLKTWGSDEEAMQRRSARWREMAAAAQLFELSAG